MLREGTLIGVVLVSRRTVQPFDDRQIALVATFADQALIAIENARLIDEIQEKSRQFELANLAKSRLLAAASHDLRQPLHALNLFVARLRDESDTAERERLIGKVELAVDSMNELFDALLDMSRLDAGVLEPISPGSRCSVCCNGSKRRLPAPREKGLSLRVAPTRAWVRSDSSCLSESCSTSSPTPCGTRGAVAIGCRRRGGMVRIDVLDSGPGIPLELQRDIFSEFYQVSGQQVDRAGLGLGLSIVERLCRLLGHTVELESRPDQGSRFSIVVPLAGAGVEQEGVESPGSTEPVPGLVVVIDDDKLVLEHAGSTGSWGWHVVTYASAAEGLKTLGSSADPI